MQIRVLLHNLDRVFALVLFGAVACLSLSAQPRFELAVRGGASMLMYESDYGRLMPGYDFGVDLLFSYRSQHVVGFRGGVAFDYAQSKFNMTNYSDSYEVVDYSYAPGMMPGESTADRMIIRYNIANVTESHNQMYLSVPLQLALHFGNFAIFLGPKLAFPMKATLKQELTDVNVTVEYPDLGVPPIPGDALVFDANSEHASRYFSYSAPIEGTPALDKYAINIFATADINYYIPVSKTSSFGIGLYADYGLPFLHKHNPKLNERAPYKSSLLWLNDPTDPSQPQMTREHVSVLQAYNLQDINAENTQTQLIRKFNYLSAGIRISYNIGGEKKEVYKHQYKDLKKCQCVFTN